MIARALGLVLCLVISLTSATYSYAQNSDSSTIKLDFKDPPNVRTVYKYDPNTGNYLEILTVGGKPVGSPRVLTMKEYVLKQAQQEREDYFRQKASATNYIKGSGIVPPIVLSPPIFDKVFGGGIIDIRPTGSAEVTFGGKWNKVENPNFTVRQQRNGQFDFGMKMQLNVTGQIGDRLKLNWNYDTEATFEFENQMKLNWGGTEDDIIKNIELGNVSLPLNGSLIQGGQNLFGVKTQLQFGKMTVTAIATQQKGETRETEVNGGAQITNFDIQASEYDVNRHFFLAQFFADQYDRALSQLPVIQSNILINYMEVWVTNRSNVSGNTRNITGFMDLGEATGDHLYREAWNPNGSGIPDNEANELFNTVKGQPFCDYTDPRLVLGTDYECLNNARQLTQNDYTFNDRLGYISLNQSLNNDEVLMVAFEYTYNGRRYQVGEFTIDNPSTTSGNNHLILKLLKPTTIKTKLPMWDLMMKNVYSLNTYNLQTEDFTMNIVYADDPSGADLNYLPVEPSETQIFEKQLIEVMNLDKVNKQMEAKPDGVFDLIEGITVNREKGRIIFPVREPFGAFVRTKFNNPTGDNADYYAFDALYDSTKWLAEQDVQKDKYFLRGTFKGSSTDEIRLQCYNITEGSVRVTANGNLLTENVDYTVNKTLGTVRIVNQGILNSGAVIKASCESNSLINIQQKSLVGARFDYKHSDKLLLGGTFMHMTERPLTPKVNIGDEPILNSIWGLDGTYNTESRMLTKLVDKLPFIETKAKSTISFTGEFAHLIPHRPRTMGDRGTSYLDDFEGAETPYDLKYVNNWKLATVPQGQVDQFPETQFGDSAYNTKRAKLAWYTIDPLFQSQQQRTPEHLTSTDFSDHFTRTVRVKEVFREQELQQGQPQQLPTLDLAYFPDERGQYNFNTTDLQADGSLANPEENWGGIMRKIETNDFEATNIDYIEVWMMDPFVYAKHYGLPINSGELYINIGNISEDVISDRKRSAENGLPTPNNNAIVDTSYLSSIPGAIVPNGQIINKAFDNDPDTRTNQDVGYDGMNDAQERALRQNYLDAIEAQYGQGSLAYQNAFNDPSNDNYLYYRDESYDGQQAPIIQRYKKYNGVEGNSTLDKLDDGTPKSGNNKPDDEDINLDHTVNMVEEYYQYKIAIDPSELRIGQNYVTDTILADGFQEDQGVKPNKVYWYQLKIPIRQYERKIGGIQDFKSIRFMRMYLKGFEDSVVLRFANLQLVRADWRRYLRTLKFPPSVGPPVDPNDDTKLVVSTVNIFENSQRDPIPYKVPPGFTREIDPTQIGNVQQNEQSLSIAVCELDKGDARGAFRTLNYDIRNYKSMRMFIHAESQTAQDGEAVAIIRVGTDLENNFYQYEIPLKLTPFGTGDATAIWPADNEFNIELEEFYRVKLNRELKGLGPTAYYSETLANGHKISVIGLPDLSNVRTVLLGVKHSENSTQDQLCSEVWFNELRLVDFVNKGGYAANARLVTKLADLATVTLAGTYQSIGFGAIDKKLNDRNLNETIQYDVSSNIELGKFFPQKTGITIPMFIGYNENIVNPKYYPLNPDILLSTAVNNAQSKEEKDAIKEAAQDFTSRYSLNFTNVQKNRTGGAGDAHFYDIENWNYSIAYQRIFRRNQIIEFNDVKTYKSSLGYNFAKRRKPWEPLRKNTKLPPIIRDFNLTFLPSNLNFRFDVNRRYSETKNRNNDNFKAIVPTLYDKTFGITRVYGWKWNIMRSLSVDYASTAVAWVEEPIGAIDTEAKLDTIRRNFFNMGRLNNFNQNINVNYNLPLRKIKFLDWVTASTRYTAAYQWRLAPPARISLGNTLQNSRTIGVNGNLNFISLYNKSPFLIKINRPPRKDKPKDPDDEDEEKEKEISPAVRGLFKGIMMLKQAQISVSATDGTTLPGFTKVMDFFGQNFKHDAPGMPFILGSQDDNIRYRFAENGFMTTDTSQNTRYMQMSSMNINGSATLEPFDGFRISISFQKRQSLNTSSNFRYVDELGVYDDLGLTEIGTFTSSFGMWNTMFDQINRSTGTDQYQSDAFDQFKNNRFVIAQRLQAQYFTEGIYAPIFGDSLNQFDDSTGFPVGFSQTHQDVMLYAFIAAYSGKNAIDVKLTPFRAIPVPNWRINYNGLSRLEPFKDIFSNISLSHAYSSTINMGSFFRPLEYGEDTAIEKGENLITQYGYQSGITLMERLTPFLGIDVTTKDGLTFRFEYKFDRSLTLNVRNLQMVEIRNKEYVIGAGFRANDVRLPFKYNGGRIVLKNDLNIRFDFTIRDGITVVRQIETDQYNATAGIKTVTIKPTIDYKINENLNFRAFYNRNVNTPVTSNSFPTALTDFGFTLRYTMQ